MDPNLRPPRPPPPPSAQTPVAPPQRSSEERKKELLRHVAYLDRALLPLLPARELHAVNPWYLEPKMFGDGRRYATDFMGAAKKLEMYFIALQKENEPTKEQLLQQEIEIMEEELKRKNALIQKSSQLIQMWRGELKEQLDRHLTALERV